MRSVKSDFAATLGASCSQQSVKAFDVSSLLRGYIAVQWMLLQFWRQTSVTVSVAAVHHNAWM